MKIIEYFTSDDKAHWLGEIAKADWGAAKFLHQLLSEGKLKETLGDSALVPLLTDGEKLVSFCTFAPIDDVQPTELSPWIGFVYTAPEYRGHRYAGEVLNWAESVATVMGREAVYISTDHTGLYEKYGYEFFRTAKSVGGEKTRIYRKELSADGGEKQKRLENGGRWKAQIVEAAKQGVDMTAICGLSCAHCFLGEWCGGCRSVFNCCSFGTMFPGGKCPNVKCCKEKNLDGCFDCPELEKCEKGFYTPSNDGAAASKAQAIFIRQHRKEAHRKVLDNLHKKYKFQKMQEILGQSVEEGIRILEENLQI
ncbi:GNAT family N-acetyltransferase [Treponema succinifaciens]|uniref:GNAT family N-acetyltransferase n=1 Tax=Treponema succinifaciens TaxID=167 RepID=UPI0023F37D7C|nr:GNAT family N-acetyltransferase [Treponema succinifaciens]